LVVLGCYSNIRAGFVEPGTPADRWNLLRKISETPSAPHIKVSGGILGNFQAWSRVNIRTMLTSWLRYPAQPGGPELPGRLRGWLRPPGPNGPDRSALRFLPLHTSTLSRPAPRSQGRMDRLSKSRSSYHKFGRSCFRVSGAITAGYNGP